MRVPPATLCVAGVHFITYIAGTIAVEIKKLGKVEKYIGKVGNYLAIRNLFEHRCRSTCTEAQMLTTAE